jgi:hypothetical protein
MCVEKMSWRVRSSRPCSPHTAGVALQNDFVGRKSSYDCNQAWSDTERVKNDGASARGARSFGTQE